MISFLILPMQRVTRLPLLTDVSTQPRPGQWGGAGDEPQLPWSHLGAGVTVLAVVTWSQHHCCCP